MGENKNCWRVKGMGGNNPEMAVAAAALQGQQVLWKYPQAQSSLCTARPWSLVQRGTNFSQLI